MEKRPNHFQVATLVFQQATPYQTCMHDNYYKEIFS